MKLALARRSLLLTTLLATYLGCAQSEYLGGPATEDAGTGGDPGQPLGPADATGTGGSLDLTGAAGTPVTGAGGAGNIGAGGSGGSTGLGGGFVTTGLGGALGQGGATGLGGRFGAGGNGASPGFGGTGSGGSFGLGGTGSGGSTAGGGHGGTSSSGGGGTGGTSSGNGGAGGAAPTFTTIYSTILTAHCSGGSCHSPGSAGGVSFSSKASAYSAVSSRVTPGDGANSGFYNTVNSGAMPRGAPKLSAANLASIKSWIDAGALNN